MKFIKILPFVSILDDDMIDCGLWKSKKNVCEMQTDYPLECETNSNLYYGTTDENEPKFCPLHFYNQVVAGDGKTNYKLVPDNIDKTEIEKRAKEKLDQDLAKYYGLKSKEKEMAFGFKQS